MIEVEIGRTASGRRTFPLAFRVEFVRRWDEAVERGAKARLMREFCVTRRTVHVWLEQRARGELPSSLTDEVTRAAERSRFVLDNRDRAELARLRKENEQLRAKVAKSEAAQDILGKAFELLSGINESSVADESIPPALMSAHEYTLWLERNNLS